MPSATCPTVRQTAATKRLPVNIYVNDLVVSVVTSRIESWFLGRPVVDDDRPNREPSIEFLVKRPSKARGDTDGEGHAKRERPDGLTLVDPAEALLNGDLLVRFPRL